VTAIVLSGCATTPLLADFTGLSWYEHVDPEWIENGYDTTVLTTWRLYARFVGTTDRVVSVDGSGHDYLQILATHDKLFNAPEGIDRLTAPWDLRFLGIWENQWDTYVTIGADRAEDDETVLSDGFGEATNHLRTTSITNDARWFVEPTSEQGVPDSDGLVLLAQFTGAAPWYPPPACGVLNLTIQEGSGDLVTISGMGWGYECPESHWAYEVDVVLGDLTGGGVDELFESDDQHVTVRARPAFAVTHPSIAVELTSSLNNVPFAPLTFSLEGASDAVPVSVEQRILLFNYLTDSWDLVDTRIAPFEDEEVTLEFGHDSYFRYYDWSSLEVRARVEYYDPGGLVTPDWSIRIDRAGWTAVLRVP
jgi:hypothetical protein